ncbi:protein of unknown function [Cupriavidus taiwanensis]|uniref:Uncharacterized protein n=1 Tax=Cupriavidus taiwanensis TaxID=164546 RepID=A0A375IEV3_9BURK|nr:hypothetical protein CBM2623_A200015 [Cupriavidus taiwanensis]SPK71755.1 protein of unknown function [Cupriavidus taiwanensis]
MCLPISPLGRERCLFPAGNIPAKIAAARGKPDIVVAPHPGCKLLLRRKGRARADTLRLVSSEK